MATRPHDRKFAALRDQERHLHPDQPLLLSMPPQPRWHTIWDSVQRDLNIIEHQAIPKLRQLLQMQCRITFQASAAASSQDNVIDDMSEQILHRLLTCRRELKRMASSATADVTDRHVQQNAAQKLTLKLQVLTADFRSLQHGYVEKKSIQQDQDDALEEAVGPAMQGYNRLSEATLSRDALRQAQAREAEILTLCKSVEDLAGLFQELSLQVIEQGSVLDRIEVNIHSAKDHVVGGTKQLQIAERSSRTPYMCICIGLFLVLIIILLIIYIYKQTSH